MKMTVIENPTLEEMQYCFDAGRNQYWVHTQQGMWIALNESQFKRILRKRGICPRIPHGDYISPLEDMLIETQETRAIHYAGSLAGCRSGFVQAEEKRILVTDSPRILQPKAGPWPTLQKVFEGLFRDSNEQQLPYFYGWLKTAFEALRDAVHCPGQALVLAGTRGCGKSLVQNLITQILGGRSARPYQYMAGATTFNSDLFEAEHLMIEDEQASTDLRARRNFGAHVKNVTVNRWQRCHAKGRPAVSLAPFWRLSITVNDEPENLMVLPPLDDSMEDKFIILRASKFPLPMPTSNLAAREAFWGRLIAELPCFLHFLTQWEIPAALQCERFGVTHFHHPAVVEAIDTMAPEFRLLRFIEEELFENSSRESWEGTAENLERTLCEESSRCRHEARKLLTYNTACGVYLGRLQKRHPQRFSVSRTRLGNTWVIRCANRGDPAAF